MNFNEYEQYLKENVLTTQQVADLLGVSRAAVSELYKRDRLIPFFNQKNVRLFSRRAVEKYQDSRYKRK